MTPSEQIIAEDRADLRSLTEENARLVALLGEARREIASFYESSELRGARLDCEVEAEKDAMEEGRRALQREILDLCKQHEAVIKQLKDISHTAETCLLLSEIPMPGWAHLQDLISGMAKIRKIIGR